MYKKPILTIISGLLAAAFTIYIALDTFVLTHVYLKIENSGTESREEASNVERTKNSYKDDKMSMTLTTFREYDTDIYVVDVVLSSAGYLKTALANDSYGKNITDTTSNMAKEKNAILAVNGDYYGVQESGYVIRNGTLYRDSSKGDQEDLVIYPDGSMQIINEKDISAQQLMDDGVYNLLCFGPGLIKNGEISVTTTDEVDKAMASNPRTAIGMIDDLHYVFVVADGRTTASEGLSLYELAEFMQSLDVTLAYNLDGGGSSTLYFNGQVINNPTTTGNVTGFKTSSDSFSSRPDFDSKPAKKPDQVKKDRSDKENASDETETSRDQKPSFGNGGFPFDSRKKPSTSSDLPKTDSEGRPEFLSGTKKQTDKSSSERSVSDIVYIGY